jgi:hypothetical protein
VADFGSFLLKEYATLFPCAADSQRHAQAAAIFEAARGFRVIVPFAPASIARTAIFRWRCLFFLLLSFFSTRAGVSPSPTGAVRLRLFIIFRRFTMTPPTTTPAKEKSYFDLHITGVGYLNRVREVQPKKGEPFLACDITALNGASDDVSYVRFDTRVSGSDAQHLVRRCAQAVEAEQKVLIGFRLGDLWTDIFTHTKGKNAGKPGVSLKARLLFVSWIKVDGKLVYKAEPKSQDDGKTTPDVPAANGASAEAQAPESSPAGAEAAEVAEAAKANEADALALAVASF